MTTDDLFGEVIFSYTRAQAIADGVLVDLSAIDAIKQHWKLPFACTAAVWAIVEPALEGDGQDVNGIFHDVSTVAKLVLSPDAQEVRFNVTIGRTSHALKLHIGPGDTAAPVLTLMLPNED